MEVKRALATSLLVSAVLAIPGTFAHAALGLRSRTLLRIYGAALTGLGLYDLLHPEREALARLFGSA